MDDLQVLAKELQIALESMDNLEFPGVIDYEVSEPFGVWFANNDPDHAEAVIKLHEMMGAFFRNESVTA